MLKYKSGSTGEEILLSGENIKAHLKTSGLHDYEWDPEEVTQLLGSEINKFGKKPAKYELVLDFCGNKEMRSKKAEEFTKLIERDVVSLKEGMLHYNECYIRCFIIGSRYEKCNLKTAVRKEVTVYAQYPFWITEQKHEFKKSEGGKTGDYLEFPFDTPFDLMGDTKGLGNMTLDHYAACDFSMTVYGPCIDPRIVIGGKLYEVKTKLDEGEYLLIDSRASTVVRVRVDGTRVDEFDNRVTEPNSLFEKIQPGYNLINWDGSFGFDLLLYIERSEPFWTG